MAQNELKYTDLAVNDLDETFKKIAEDKPGAAIDYIDAIDKAILNLIDNPLLGMHCKRKNVCKDCRVLVAQSHLVFYKYEKEKSIICILRVLWSDQDYDRIMNKET